MGKNTNIGWCHHTFNPWWGCVKISPGCKFCYAAAFDARLGGEHWSVDGPRRFFDDDHWKEPLRWNRAAQRDGVRRRVFCMSMGDWAERLPGELGRKLDECRRRLWTLIALTPWLDWLLLTKRPENVAEFLPGPIRTLIGHRLGWNVFPWSNVWLGVTAEDQEHAAKRIPVLLSIPAVVWFVSYEPALEGIDFRPWLGTGGIDWLIAGCESGRGPKDTRPYDISWFQSARDQCAENGKAYFLKQATDVVELVPSRGLVQISGVGPGTTITKKRNVTQTVLEAPYLDGRQHQDVPIPRAA